MHGAPIVLTGLSLLAGSGLAQVDTVTILHLNDTHSNLASIGPRGQSLQGTRGGIARAATAIAAVRASQPNVLFLHAGDFSIGDFFYNLTFGVAELRILAGLRCDALTLGNHEFDLAPPTLQAALDSAFIGASIPLLSANLLLPVPAVRGLSRHIVPYVIKRAGLHSVGVFGLTTPSTNVLARPGPAVIDTGFVQCAAAMVDTLKRRGCDAVLLLSHLGLNDDRRLATAIPGIAAIIGGHDHLRLREPVAVKGPSGDTTWIVQAQSFYLDLGFLQLVLDGKKVRLHRSALMPLDSTVLADPPVASAVQALTERIEGVYGPVYSRQIAACGPEFEEIASELARPGWKDTPVGNLVTDAFRAAFRTQIAVEAGGSTAQPLHPGPLVPADVFRMVGYGFNEGNGLGYRMATWEIRGADLRSGLEFGLSSIEIDDEYLLQVSGLRYEYDPAAPAGSRVVSATVGSRPLDDTAWYTVASNEFALSFLQYLRIPVRNATIHGGDSTEFQIVLSHVAGAGTLKAVREGRVKVRARSSRPSH